MTKKNLEPPAWQLEEQRARWERKYKELRTVVIGLAIAAAAMLLWR
ncbi:MAG TPA: hypothetical protein VGC20_13335 [bacterium]